MTSTPVLAFSPILLASVALTLPGGAFAYDTEDAIRDCESRIRSEYQLTDLRDPVAEQLSGDKHYRVRGKAKVDGEKYHWTCEVKNRHVTSAEYDGPKPEGLTTAQKIAIGAAAVAIGVAASEASKHQDQDVQSNSHSGHHGSGAAALQDLVGVKASSGEMEMEDRGYEFVSGSQGGGGSYSNWLKGSHCVTVRTRDGRYESIVDVTMLDCD